MALGLILVAAAIVLFCAKYSINTKVHMQNSDYAPPRKKATPLYYQNTKSNKDVIEQPRFVTNLTGSP